MLWSDEAQGGFTTGTPWIGVNENYTEINAASCRMKLERNGEVIWLRPYEAAVLLKNNSKEKESGQSLQRGDKRPDSLLSV